MENMILPFFSYIHPYTNNLWMLYQGSLLSYGSTGLVFSFQVSS
jgi:hypothetical protein